jgi:peptide/nickel transport system permease protein
MASSSRALPAFLLRRALHSFVVVVAAVVLVFMVTHVVGDPVQLLLPLEATEQQRDDMRDTLGLNDPVLTQFGRFVGDAAQGDLGESLWQRRPAAEVVLERLPATLLLVASAFSVSLIAALVLGTLAALRPGSFADKLITTTSLVGVSIPNFFLALMLVLLVAVNVKGLPTAGYGTWQHLVLPTLALAALSTGRITQIVRSSVIDEMSKPYVTAARARGASMARTVTRHVLKNAAIPIVTLSGWELVRMLAGYMVPVEAVFSWPGVGLLAIDAVEQFDFAVIQAVVLLVAVMVVTVNFVIELLYAWLNPRIRFG